MDHNNNTERDVLNNTIHKTVVGFRDTGTVTSTIDSILDDTEVVVMMVVMMNNKGLLYRYISCDHTRVGYIYMCVCVRGRWRERERERERERMA